MKHIHFDIESNGFYGAYWECKDGSDCASHRHARRRPRGLYGALCGEVAASPFQGF